MGTVIGEVLALAVAIAISPLPIIVVVLILVSDGAHVKSLGYLVGRFLGFAVLFTAVLFFAGARGDEIGAHKDPSTTAEVIRIVIGVLLVIYAGWLWHTRPRPGEEPKPSLVIRRIDKVTPATAVVAGIAFVVLDATSLSLGMMAGIDIGMARLPVVESVIVAVLFTAVASLSAIIPILIYFAGGDAAQRILTAAKAWLTANEKVVMMVLFLLMGAVLIGRAIARLAA